MNCLDNFKNMISLYNGMLIETGGKFGEGKLGGDKYGGKCIEIAQCYISDGGCRQMLLSIIDDCILEYADDTEWKYLSMELAFLNKLKENIISL